MSGDAGQRGLQGCSARLDYSRFGDNLAVAQARGKEEKVEMLTSGVIGLLTGPHQTSFFDESSSTIRLSEGDRPVLAPEYADSAPVDVMAEPDSYTRASS